MEWIWQSQVSILVDAQPIREPPVKEMIHRKSQESWQFLSSIVIVQYVNMNIIIIEYPNLTAQNHTR